MKLLSFLIGLSCTVAVLAIALYSAFIWHRTDEGENEN